MIQTRQKDSSNVWFVGCGAAIGFAAGTVPRAPSWMQHTGLASSYRLFVEPRRVGQRCLAHDLPFAARMLARALVQPRPSTQRRDLAA